MAERESLFSLRPVPGSSVARKAGCTCSDGGLWQRVVDWNCPVHGPMIARKEARAE